MANNNAKAPRLLVTLTALFAALCGLYLLIGGGWLVAIGGSWYYPIAGIVMLGVAGLFMAQQAFRAVAVCRPAPRHYDLGRVGSRLRLLGANPA